MTPEQYELSVLSNYMSWSLSHNQRNDDITQRMMVSQPLFSWWMEQYRKLENNFLKLIGPYTETISKDEAARMYKLEILKIFNLYSKPLIYCAKYKHQNITATLN